MILRLLSFLRFDKILQLFPLLKGEVSQNSCMPLWLMLFIHRLSEIVDVYCLTIHLFSEVHFTHPATNFERLII